MKAANPRKDVRLLKDPCNLHEKIRQNCNIIHKHLFGFFSNRLSGEWMERVVQVRRFLWHRNNHPNPRSSSTGIERGKSVSGTGGEANLPRNQVLQATSRQSLCLERLKLPSSWNNSLQQKNQLDGSWILINHICSCLKILTCILKSSNAMFGQKSKHY